ncbi:MAG: hypothetical protein L0Y54_10295 [Sporichthyaceae bacterium]|nr:hypothetical protein [Sporichthyaceae bacterium]
MSGQAVPAPAARTYGGWRRSRGLGLGRLDARQTLIVLASLVVPLLVYAAGAHRAAATLGGAGAVVSLAAIAQRDGVLLADAAAARLRWRWAAWRGQTSYRGGVLVAHPHALNLPGVLAATELLDVEDPGRGRAGAIWNRRSGHLAVSVVLAPAGALLADRATVDRQITAWGELLAGLADDPAIRSAAVTVDLAVGAGHTLAEHISDRVDPDAPHLARVLLRELAATAPAGAARSSTRLSLLVNPGAVGAKSMTEAAAVALRTLRGLNLPAAGAEVVRTATAADLLTWVRAAYDPLAGAADPAEAGQLSWASVGPIYAEEALDYYRHDRAWSTSWILLSAPRQRVPHDVLLPLLSAGRFPRRVSLLYRVLSRDEAGAVLERELAAATAREEYRQRTRRDPTARDTADAQRAGIAAAEEAHGSGLVEFTALVTATVADPTDLPAARQEVEQAAGRSRVRLRLAYGAQSAIFAAGLPCGIQPARFQGNGQRS